MFMNQIRRLALELFKCHLEGGCSSTFRAYLQKRTSPEVHACRSDLVESFRLSLIVRLAAFCRAEPPSHIGPIRSCMLVHSWRGKERIAAERKLCGDVAASRPPVRPRIKDSYSRPIALHSAAGSTGDGIAEFFFLCPLARN